MDFIVMPYDCLRAIHDYVKSLALYNTSAAIRARLFNGAMTELSAMYMCCARGHALVYISKTNEIFADIVHRRNNNRYKPAFIRIVSDLILFTEWLRRYPGKYPRYIVHGHDRVVRHAIHRLAEPNKSDTSHRFANLCINVVRVNRIDILAYILDKKSFLPLWSITQAVGEYGNTSTISYARKYITLSYSPHAIPVEIIKRGRLDEYKKMGIIDINDDHCFAAGSSGDIDTVNHILSQCALATKHYYVFIGACKRGHVNIMDAVYPYVNYPLILAAKNASADAFIALVKQRDITDFSVFRWCSYSQYAVGIRDFLAIRGYAPWLDAEHM